MGLANSRHYRQKVILLHSDDLKALPHSKQISPFLEIFKTYKKSQIAQN